MGINEHDRYCICLENFLFESALRHHGNGTSIRLHDIDNTDQDACRLDIEADAFTALTLHILAFIPALLGCRSGRFQLSRPAICLMYMLWTAKRLNRTEQSIRKANRRTESTLMILNIDLLDALRAGLMYPEFENLARTSHNECQSMMIYCVLTPS